VAEIKNAFLGRIIGKGGTTISMIKNKSGANLQMLKPTGAPIESDPHASTRIVVVGSPECVSLATQMIQEVPELSIF
jgi:hypothetical protein